LIHTRVVPALGEPWFVLSFLFSLVVDDFGVKYVGKEHVDHLLEVLNKYHPTSTD
jgi:hypothetical protein